MVILTIQSLHRKLVEEEMSSGIYQIKILEEMHSVGVYIHCKSRTRCLPQACVQVEERQKVLFSGKGIW